MKIRILPILVAGLMAATAFLSSCLGSDYEEIEYPSTSSIKSFSIGTLYQTFYVKSSKGEDSVYTDTVSYADVPFTIDQINRRIYNNDSLPKDVDITRVVASISADYDAIYYEKDGKDTIWTSADSLDFTKPLTFKVMSYIPSLNQFKTGYPYQVTVNVHKLNPDSLVWKNFSNSFGQDVVLSKHKAVYHNSRIYVFGETQTGNTKVYTSETDRGNIINGWTDVTPEIAGINIYSAMVFNNDVYYIAEGGLYNLSSTSKIGTETNLSNLVSVNGQDILAYTNDNKVVKLNAYGEKESECDFIDGENLNGNISYISYPAAHNTSLWRTVVMKNGAEADTTATVFSYISSDNEWVKFQPNNPATCPNQNNISMIAYDGKIFAYGEDFDYFYSSLDNGLNWKEETEYMVFPSENKNGIDKLTTYRQNGSYSTVVEDNGNKGSFIWFIWQDGSMTRAILNRLMPKE